MSPAWDDCTPKYRLKRGRGVAYCMQCAPAFDVDVTAAELFPPTMSALTLRMYLRLGTLLTLTLTLARAAEAQSDGVGRIDGVVFDSVHARPLAGVQVVAVGTASRSDVRGAATSDSTGRYRIDSLPAGRYSVAFESALLDSLEITLSPREATVGPGSVATLDLAMPPAAKLRSAVCPVALPSETGVIYGHVVSAETESPLAGVVLAMAWNALGVDRKTLRPVKGEQNASVTTDDGGWYRMCGVPTGTWVSMQLQHEGREGPVLRTRVDDTLGIAIRHVSFSATASRPQGETANSEADTPQAGSAIVRGIVQSPGGAPVASAEVRVRGTRAVAQTDALGAYSLGGLPAGTQELEVRRVGFAVAVLPVELRSGTTTTRDVRLGRVVVSLDSMRVVADRTKYPEFSEHQETFSFGRFLGPEEIERQRVSRTADIIEKIPGFRIVQRGTKSDVMTNRGGLCRVNIVIDGVILKSEDKDAVTINDVHPSDIGAIEAYREGDHGPGQYDRGCGAIVIWTKR